MEEGKPLKGSKPKKANKSDKPGFSDKFKDYRAEFKKIIWPNKTELRKKTITVIITSLIMGVVIFGIDSVFTGAQSLILHLLGY